MFRFTIRELVLLTLVVAMGVGWWLERRAMNAVMRQQDRELRVRELMLDVANKQWKNKSTPSALRQLAEQVVDGEGL